MKAVLAAALLSVSAALAVDPTEEVFVPPRPEKPLRFCTATETWLKFAEGSPDYEEITELEGLKLDLRYATFDNASGHDLYCGKQRAFLHKDAAKKLKKAIGLLGEEMPGAKFLIFDAARPLYAQEALRASVRGTPYSHYVSSPGTGSVHNFGMAVDLGIETAAGEMLDMGTDFDSFESAAGRSGEAAALKSGRLTKKQISNRESLRKIMKAAGFIELPSEWWHFNALPSKQVRELYQKAPL